MYLHIHFMLVSDGGMTRVTQTGATVVDIDGCKIEDFSLYWNDDSKNCSSIMSGPFWLKGAQDRNVKCASLCHLLQHNRMKFFQNLCQRLQEWRLFWPKLHSVHCIIHQLENSCVYKGNDVPIASIRRNLWVKWWYVLLGSCYERNCRDVCRQIYR